MDDVWFQPTLDTFLKHDAPDLEIFPMSDEWYLISDMFGGGSHDGGDCVQGCRHGGAGEDARYRNDMDQFVCFVHCRYDQLVLHHDAE